MRLMEGEHVGPFNLGNPGEFTMLELAKVCHVFIPLRISSTIFHSFISHVNTHNSEDVRRTCITYPICVVYIYIYTRNSMFFLQKMVLCI